jgi:hypothetical protein
VGRGQNREAASSVVIAGLEEVDPVVADQIDDATLLSQAARPGSGRQVLEGLGFTESLERVAQDRFNEV